MSLRRLSVFLMLLFLSVTQVPSVAAESYSEIRSDYRLLIKSAQLQRQRVNWEKLIRRFDRYLKNPAAENVDKALFLKARTWDGLSQASGGQEDAREAISHYLHMVDQFPKSQLADDALFASGQIAENRLNDPSAAYRYYRWLLEQLPDGDMAKEAKARLVHLPEPPLQVAPKVKETTYSARADSPRLENIRYWSGPDYTRVVFDLSAPVATEPHLLKGDKPRLYFDLPYTELAPELQQEVPILNGLVQRVRANYFDEQRTRVVVDLYRQTDYKVVSMENPYRLVVDLLGASRQPANKPTHKATQQGGADDSIANILNKIPTHQSVLHVPQQGKDEGIHLIVVDAGHGGKDPGAVGPRKVMEKDVALGMAKALAAALRKQLGVKVLLTRSDDRYLGLRERTAYANRVGADLFISLHANASKTSKVYGLETYFLNLSKNNQAAEVAARENGTTLQDVGNLEAILFDLMANAKINESSRLAAKVQKALISGLRPHYSRIKDLGVRQGPFHVLLGATMPSVLVEAAFISNSREEKRLVNKTYQKRVADAVVQGVRDYAATVKKVAKR